MRNLLFIVQIAWRRSEDVTGSAAMLLSRSCSAVLSRSGCGGFHLHVREGPYGLGVSVFLDG